MVNKMLLLFIERLSFLLAGWWFEYSSSNYYKITGSKSAYHVCVHVFIPAKECMSIFVRQWPEQISDSCLLVPIFSVSAWGLVSFCLYRWSPPQHPKFDIHISNLFTPIVLILIDLLINTWFSLCFRIFWPFFL